MGQNIFNNIILLIIIYLIIRQVSPEPDSLLFILKKYLNFIVYKIKNLFRKNEGFSNFLRTFKGLPTFNPSVPSFKTAYQINFINYIKTKNPNVSEQVIQDIYYFLQTLVNINTDQYFTSPNDTVINKFNESEIDKIKNILLKKLNSSTFKFDNLVFESELSYYLNFSGKQVEPFIINIDSSIGNIRIYIDLDIRNDIYQNKEYIVINEIKPLKDKQIIFNNKNIFNNNLEKAIKQNTINLDKTINNPNETISNPTEPLDSIFNYDINSSTNV